MTLAMYPVRRSLDARMLPCGDPLIITSQPVYRSTMKQQGKVTTETHYPLLTEEKECPRQPKFGRDRLRIFPEQCVVLFI